MDTTHSFGYWVRRRRKARDLSQRELAELAACSLPAIKKIEQDTRRPSLELAESLAEALAIPETERETFLRSARGLAQVDEMPLASQPLVSPTVGNLLASVGPLFGRNDELEQLSERLSGGETRLITVVGPGGVGKSTLALEAARRAQAQYQDGAWFVPLAGVEDPTHLSSAIAIALEMTFAGPLDPEQQLLRLLQDRHILLVLDNFEQLLPDGAGLAADLIGSLSDLALLVTSRERLRLQAETTVPILGLPIEPARALFIERAQRAGVNLSNTEEDSSIEGICRLVGGLPLAIELAAAWARLLPPTEILSDLEHSLDLLTGDLHDLPGRHRSMQAVFDSSWTRLSLYEQELLAGLSVFAGSFSRDAAESICGATLPQLAMLHDHSLIQREGERFRLHELLRQFATEKLASLPDEPIVKDRHAAHYASFLGRLSGLYKTGGPQLAGLERGIDREIDNIHVAWHWAIRNDHPQRLLPATLALFVYMDTSGQVRDGAQMFAALGESAAKVRAEGLADDTVLRRTQAMALMAQGELYLRMGEPTRQQQQLRQAALSLLDGLEAPDERVVIQPYFGLATMLTKDYAASQKILEEALNLARAEDHVFGKCLAISFLGMLHLVQGRLEEGRDFMIEADALFEQTGIPYGKGRNLINIGLAHHALGDYENAQAVQEEALRLTLQIQDNSFVPVARCSLAFHHYAQGELELAKDGFRTALAEAQRFGLFNSVWLSITGLGLVAAAEGQPSQAVTLLTFSPRKHGGYLFMLLGEPDRVLASLRAELPPAEFAAAEAQGREMELDDLLGWF